MCNLYSLTKGQASIIEIARAMRDRIGDLPALPSIFPDSLAAVVYHAPEDNVRDLPLMRWGFSPPPNAGNQPVTNIRNTASPFWRAWLKPQYRCLVPVTSFCEYTDTKPRKRPHWFAINEARPLFCFAGLWQPWAGTRGPKTAALEGEHRLFAFLTTDANEVVRPVHPKAMPLILSGHEQCEQWLTTPVQEALKLRRPAADNVLRIVASGARADG